MYRENATEDRSLLIVALTQFIVALDARTGKMRWEYALGGARAAEVLVHAGRVYAVAAQRSFVVLDYATGRRITMHPVATWNGRPTMLLEGQNLLLASGGEVFCFDLDGELLWHNRMKGRGVGSVALALPDHARQADVG